MGCIEQEKLSLSLKGIEVMWSVLCRFHPMGQPSLQGRGITQSDCGTYATRETIAVLEGHTRIVASLLLTYSPDGTMLASMDIWMARVRLWDVSNRRNYRCP